MSIQNQKYTFHIHGMHCNACVLIIESELKDIPVITYVKASLKNHSVEIEGNFEHKTEQEIIESLTLILRPHGYSVSIEKQKHTINWKDFKIAIPAALIFGVLFVLLQKLGIVNLIQADQVTYGTAFMIGVVASLSTCMAVVGGLLLSMSATFVKEGDKIKPQIMFHIGRIVSFFVLGGVIGAIGSAFTLSISATLILNIIIAIVMLILGINLLDIFPWVKKIQPAMPKYIAKYAHGISNVNHTLTPLLVGVATFFLPCGFTQSMQLYTLTTGNFFEGGFTMLAFAFGTLPVLTLVSFSSFSIQKTKVSGIFFKSAGLIVLMFVLFNIINSLVILGIISPIFNF